MNLLSARLKRQTVRSLAAIAAREAGRLWNRRWHVFSPPVPDSVEGTRWKALAADAFPGAFRERYVHDALRVLEGHRECFGALQSWSGMRRWDTDYYSGRRWRAGAFYRRYPIVDGVDGSDIKVPWELSRCHHLLPLAKAYLLTGDERYAAEVAKEIHHWIQCNPFARSVNWTCAMEVAIRAVNWLWALRLCSSYFEKHEDLVHKFNRSLFAHGIFVRANLEKNVHGFSSNHYYADLVGMICLGLHFREEPRARQWLQFAIPRFYEQTCGQFFQSGPHFELAIGYHRLVTEMLLAALCALRHAGTTVPADVLQRARNALDYIAHYSRPDGSVPLIGDADDGRLLIFEPYCDWDRGTHRYLLALGHALFGEKRWAQESLEAYEGAGYLLEDPSVFRLASQPPVPLESKAFADAGMYCLRSQSHVLVVKLSNQGAYETAGWHTHNDVLSFDLTVNGIPMLVDPGVGNYSGSIAERNLFRSTRMHNTVMVDGVEQNSFDGTPQGLWRNGGEARPTVEIWRSTAHEDVLQGSHAGYTRLATPVVHRRLFRFLKDAFVLDITDSFEVDSPHDAEWNYILHPDVVPHKSGETVWTLEARGQRLQCECTVQLEVQECWYSPGYKQKVRTLRLTGRRSTETSPTFLTRLKALT